MAEFDPDSKRRHVIRYFSSQISPRDRIALLAAISLSLGFGSLTGLAGYGGFFVGGFYSALIVPCVVIFSDERKLLVWQVCVLSFVFCIIAWVSYGYPWRQGEVGQVAFVFWSLVTVVSAPIPAGFFVLRLNGRWRYFASIVVAAAASAL